MAIHVVDAQRVNVWLLAPQTFLFQPAMAAFCSITKIALNAARAISFAIKQEPSPGPTPKAATALSSIAPE